MPYKMFKNVVLPAVLSCLSFLHTATAEQTFSSWTDHYSALGRYKVSYIRYDWFDKKRDRIVPVKIYYPQTEQGKFPVIIFSHGLGGSREGYEYLGSHWASHGYISVHLQHKASDTDIWLDRPQTDQAVRRVISDPNNIRNRPMDVRFCINRLKKLQKQKGPLKDFLNLNKIGMAGHSFGAQTTLAVAGQLYIDDKNRKISFAEPRISAAIVMSPSVPQKKDKLDEIYKRIRIPTFHMTGTLDNSPVISVTAEDRRIPFDCITTADCYLLIFRGGDHMVYAGHRRYQGTQRKDPIFHRLILAGSTAFWDAYLKSDAAAMDWLCGGQFETLLKNNAAFEKKLK